MSSKVLLIILGTLLFQVSAETLEHENTIIVPYLVSLRHLNNTHFCNGVLVDKKWILTIKECLVGMDQKNVFGVIGLHEFKSGPEFLPTAKNNEEINDNEILEETKEKMHEPLNENQILKCIDFVFSEDLNGLAMIEINTEQDFSIELNLNKSEEFIKDSVMIGWGMCNDFPPRFPDFYSYHLANDGACNNSFFNETLQMCFVPSENILCFGHQGSPIIVDNKLVGIISESLNATAVAFRISEYYQQIKDTISGRGYVKWLFAFLVAMLAGS